MAPVHEEESASAPPSALSLTRRRGSYRSPTEDGGRSHECSIATFCLSAMLLTELAQFIRDEAPSDADPRHTLDFDIKIDQATTPPEYTCGSSEVLSLGGRQVGHGQTHGGTTHILRHGII